MKTVIVIDQGPVSQSILRNKYILGNNSFLSSLLIRFTNLDFSYKIPKLSLNLMRGKSMSYEQTKQDNC